MREDKREANRQNEWDNTTEICRHVTKLHVLSFNHCSHYHTHTSHYKMIVYLCQIKQRLNMLFEVID